MRNMKRVKGIVRLRRCAGYVRFAHKQVVLAVKRFIFTSVKQEQMLLDETLQKNKERFYKVHGVKIACSAILAGVLIFSAVFLVPWAVPVSLADGQHVVQVSTTTRTVADLLKEHGIVLGKFDDVKPSLQQSIGSNSTVSITRAIPVVIKADGKENATYVLPGTVAEALRQRDVLYDENDRIAPDLKETVQAGMTISLQRVEIQQIHAIKNLWCDLITQESDALYIGKYELLQSGIDGFAEHLMNVVYVDGQEETKELVSETILSTPRPQIVHIGSKPTPSPTPKPNSIRVGGKVFMYSKKMSASATAYYNQYSRNTATGTWPRQADGTTKGWGTIAVNPKFIPLHTRVYIPGYGFAIAEDTGGAYLRSKTNRIDLFMNTHSQCVRWGVRPVTIYVLK